MTFEEAIMQLRGIKEICAGLSTSELVQDEQPVYDLISYNLEQIIPALVNEFDQLHQLYQSEKAPGNPTPEPAAIQP